MQNETVLVIGTGNMGGAIAQGLAHADHAPELILCDHNPTRHANLKTRFPAAQVVQAISQVQQSPSVIILAVKPHDLKIICQHLTAELADTARLYLSVAAGVPHSALINWLGQNAVLVRAMPNTPSEIGLGMTGLYTSTDTSTEHKNIADSIMQAVGKTLWLDTEEQLDALTALSKIISLEQESEYAE